MFGVTDVMVGEYASEDMEVDVCKEAVDVAEVADNGGEDKSKKDGGDTDGADNGGERCEFRFVGITKFGNPADNGDLVVMEPSETDFLGPIGCNGAACVPIDERSMR